MENTQNHNKNQDIKERAYKMLRDSYNEHVRISDSIEGRLKIFIQMSATLAVIGSGFLYLYKKLSGNSDMLILIGFALFAIFAIISMLTSFWGMITSLAELERGFVKVKEFTTEDSYNEFKNNLTNKYMSDSIEGLLQHIIRNIYIKTKLINYKNRYIWKSFYCLSFAFLALIVCIISAFILRQF